MSAAEIQQYVNANYYRFHLKSKAILYGQLIPEEQKQSDIDQNLWTLRTGNDKTTLDGYSIDSITV